MTTSLFSLYRQREDRVTSTILAVLERLSLPNIERILQGLLNEKTFSLITFENQPKGKSSRPDAKIRTSPAVWIETKTWHNSVNHVQIKNHLQSLASGEKLLLLTPDENRPPLLDSRVQWSNFQQLVKSVQGILSDEDEPASEKEAFLLRELVRMLKQDGLIGSYESRVLVLAAKAAWAAYKEFSVYMCPGSWSFRPSGYIAFSKDNEIKPRVAKIKSVIKPITFDKPGAIESLDGEQRELAKQLKNEFEMKKGRVTQEMRDFFQNHFSRAHQWIFLSGLNDEETLKLANPVKNDKKSKSGKGTAFTQKYTYVNLESLRTATKTSDLTGA